MAIDTRERRASLIGLGLPGLAVAPLPDGAVSEADRAQLGWLYAGLDYTAVPAVGLVALTLRARSVALTLEARSAALTLHPRSVALTLLER